MAITINNDVIHGNRMCRGLACLSQESVATIKNIEDGLKQEDAGSQTVLKLESMLDNYKNSLGANDPAALQPLLQLIRAAGPNKREVIGFLDKFSSKNSNNPEPLKGMINLAKKIGTADGAAALLALRDSFNFKPGILANEAFCREFTLLVGQLSGAGSDTWTILISSLSDSKFTPDYGGMKELAEKFAQMRSLSPGLLKMMAKELKEADGNMHAGEVFNNIKYALATIGEEMTVSLNDKCGIIYFSRYSKGTLRQAYNDINPSGADEKHVLLAVYNKNDRNGAFYQQKEELDDIRPYYRLALFETNLKSSDFASQRPYYSLPPSFYSTIKNIWTNYGPIDSLIVGGHTENLIPSF